MDPPEPKPITEGGSPQNQNFMGAQDPEGDATTGKRIVFIIDKSGSMAQGWPYSRWGRVKAALLTTIAQMEGNIRYNIYLFDDFSHRHPMGWSDPNQWGGTWTWLQTIIPGSQGTDPTAAFRSAMSSGADVAYFLTDGEFKPVAGPPPSHNTFKTLNVNNIPVNTITVADTTAGGLMRAIADDSGGVYRHV
jgi:uncharacterized protein with von Willebrand factor type A (vWA) domain